MKKYIDFDGVIMDTYMPLFKNYAEKKKLGKYISDTDYVINQNWQQVIAESEVINNALNIIKELDQNEIAILTKIHSLENEGVAKIKFLRHQGIKCNIILVPYLVKKADVVDAMNAILVDDSVLNLDEWTMAGGIPIFFDNRGTNIDGWSIENKIYTRTRSLEILKKY